MLPQLPTPVSAHLQQAAGHLPQQRMAPGRRVSAVAAPLQFPGHAAQHLRLLGSRQGTAVVPQAPVQGHDVEEQSQGLGTWGAAVNPKGETNGFP